MSRVPPLLILGSLVSFVFGTGWALAGSASQCLKSGGIAYEQNGPDSVCIYPEEQVANDNASPNNNSRKTQETDTGQGTFKNKTETTCEGPPGKCK
jgi:hypothetical protein